MRFYDQLALVFKGEAPVDSVPATILEFNIHKQAEKVLGSLRQHREAIINEYPEEISKLVRAEVIKLYNYHRDRYRARLSAQGLQRQVEKVTSNNSEWSDWV
ncbi:hypothetical protein DDSR119_27 [Pseudomonas phage DDSR119]|nr:hypothetical protein DDSR119_27 [Pseudomonas phage DDSR119]